MAGEATKVVTEDGRCTAFVRYGERKGERCKRAVAEGSVYCSQHQEMIEQDKEEIIEFITRHAKFILGFITGSIGQAVIGDLYTSFKTSKLAESLWGTWGGSNSNNIEIDFDSVVKVLEEYISERETTVMTDNHSDRVNASATFDQSRDSSSLLSLISHLNPNMAPTDVEQLLGKPDRKLVEDPTPDSRIFAFYHSQKGEIPKYSEIPPYERRISLFLVFAPLAMRSRHVIIDGQFVIRDEFSTNVDQIFRGLVDVYQRLHGGSR